MTLAELAIHEREFIHTYLCGLLTEPFHTLVHLGGCHGYMQMSLPRALLGQYLQDGVMAPVSCLCGNLCTNKRSVTIHQIQFIPYP